MCVGYFLFKVHCGLSLCPTSSLAPLCILHHVLMVFRIAPIPSHQQATAVAFLFCNTAICTFRVSHTHYVRYGRVWAPLHLPTYPTIVPISHLRLHCWKITKRQLLSIRLHCIVSSFPFLWNATLKGSFHRVSSPSRSAMLGVFLFVPVGYICFALPDNTNCFHYIWLHSVGFCSYALLNKHAAIQTTMLHITRP